MRRRPIHLAALALVVAVGPVAACSDDGGTEAIGGLVEAHRVPAAQATALAVDLDGQVLAGELETGRILAIDPGTGRRAERAQLDPIDTRPTQRGLLGLVVADDGTVLAALTAADGHIEVAAVDDDGALSTRWRGPRSADEANGGRLVALADGSVAIGIGDLLDPDRTADPEAPNGKALRIDGPDAVTPLAGGLNNPFAMAAGPEGTVWVADNAPGRRPERLLRFPAEPDDDAGPVPEPEVVAEWTDTRVPSGLAWLADGRLALCSYATSELRVVDADEVDELDDPETGTLVADDCRYGVVALPEGGLAYAAEDAVVVLRPT